MCLCHVILLVVSLRIADASPATFETPLDARHEDDHLDAEEESGKRTNVDGKDSPPTAYDDKSPQDSNKRKETLCIFLNGKTQVVWLIGYSVLAASSSETLIFTYQAARCHIPELLRLIFTAVKS